MKEAIDSLDKLRFQLVNNSLATGNVFSGKIAVLMKDEINKLREYEFQTILKANKDGQ
jgi:hypothetical protein